MSWIFYDSIFLNCCSRIVVLYPHRSHEARASVIHAVPLHNTVICYSLKHFFIERQSPTVHASFPYDVT